MENVSEEIISLIDISITDEQLDKKISNELNLKVLITFLKLKQRRILEGRSRKIMYNVHKIYQQRNEESELQCEVLKIALLVIENLEEEISQVIKYLNFQLEVDNSFELEIAFKLARILNEIILICKSQTVQHVFQENISLDSLNKFLFNGLKQENTLRVYILSTVLPNYVSILNELHQLQFLNISFLECNLNVLCIIFNCIEEKVLLTNSDSLLFSYDFWLYLESCISSESSSIQKSALFFLKKWVRIYHNCKVECETPYLQVTDACDEASEKIWQHFFTLIDASKEKQLHLIWPALTLLSSLEHLNTIWQVCVYKRLLAHTQNAVVYSVASQILVSNNFLPSLNKCFLSAINKNEYSSDCIEMFKILPVFCNDLEMKHFIMFLEHILDITWTPTAAWCLFSNMFTESLTKTIPFKIIEPTYNMLKQLPHLYIRNGCSSVFLNYIIKNFNWKNNFDKSLKLLFVIKDYDNDLFIKTVIEYIDIDILNIDSYRIEANDLDMNLFDAYIQIIKILKYEKGVETILKSTSKSDKKILLAVYSNFFDKFEVYDIEKFVLEQIDELDEDNVQNFLSIIKEAMKSYDFREIVFSKILFILDTPNNYSQTTLYVALYVLLNFYQEKESIKNTMVSLKKCFEFGKTNDGLYILFLKLYFLIERPKKKFLQNIFHNHSDLVICKMFEYLSTLKFHKDCSDIIIFLKETLNVLVHFTKSRHFKNIISNYINCVFSKSFLQTLCDSEMLEMITLITDSLLSLSHASPIIDYYLSEKLKEITISPEFSGNLSFSLTAAISELLLKGVIIKKDDRVEYCICQEIYEKLGDQIGNPNFTKIVTRMSSLESMLQIVYKNPEFADDFSTRLMNKYRIYFNKRYFPDSEIHLQKLRIVQALLTIQSFIKSQKQPLVDLIMESFCTEIHQPCVKQLMQWLLLCLLNNQDDNYFNLIKAKIDTANKAQPSSIVAFIVVLFHLTLDKDESYWFSTVEALIPWCMGAHFKLRVYSQVAIKKLVEEAKRKSYQDFLNKYGYLEKSILSVIEASGTAFYDTLKSDELIFTTFNPQRDYSLQTIYVDIPRLNGVTRSEWENIFLYKFIAHKGIDVENENKTFSSAILTAIEKNCKGKISDELPENTQNIQRKIAPVEFALEEEREHVSDFILVASLIDKSTNLGGLSRTCEVFGVKQLVLNDIKILKDKEFKSLSMSSEDWINAAEVKISDLKHFVSELRSKGYTVIGAEQTSESGFLYKYKFNRKTALVLGNEKEGIPPDIIPILDECIEIPQFGRIRSLNVHVAGATFIWEYVKQNLV